MNEAVKNRELRDKIAQDYEWGFVSDVEQEFADAQYGDFKKAVAATIVEHLAPIRDRYQELQGDRAKLEDVLRAGAERARSIASETLADVRERMGVGPPD